ncbi:MAG: hypothetical protein KAR22_16450 [Gammaproteobacteria bacterium]|nr:hypothetical protein [Gammaproteobacteria bacterium]
MRTPILLSCMLLLSIQAPAQDEPRPVRRMGAYQCLDCAAGGFLMGIRQGGYGRVRREFPPNRRLCVASYQNVAGEQYVFFQLGPMTSRTDGAWTIRRERSSAGMSASGERYARITLDDGGWPDGGEWGLKSNSWNAECHDPKAQ